MHQRDYLECGMEPFVVLCFFLLVSSHCQEYQCTEIIFLIHTHEYKYMNVKWERQCTKKRSIVCVCAYPFLPCKKYYISRVFFKSHIINCLCNKDFDIEFPFGLHFYVWRPWNRMKSTSLCCDENATKRSVLTHDAIPRNQMEWNENDIH